jgi:PAS domain S-box-containing protein
MEDYKMMNEQLVSDLNLLKAENALLKASYHKEYSEKKDLEIQLAQSHQWYSSLFQLNHSIILIIDTFNGQIIDANPAASKFYGWNHAELCAKNIAQINTLAPTEVKMEIENAHTMKQNSFIFQHRLANGDIRDVEVYSGPIKYGNSTHLFSIIHDISNRKAIKKALIESELRYRTLADSGQALIWTSGPDKRCNYFNKVWLDFTGRTLDQELGDGWADGVHPDDLDYLFNFYTNSFDKREPFKIDYRLRNRNGDYRWIQDHGTPQYNSMGDFIGYIGHCLDITESKLAENENKDKSTILTNLLLNLQEGILLEDANRKITLTNQLFCDMFGIPVPPELLIGADCSNSAEQSKQLFKDPEKFVSDISKILFYKVAVYNDELELADGRYFERDYIPTYLEQNYNGHLWKYRDITVRKQAVNKLRDLNDNLELKINQRTNQLSNTNETLRQEIVERKKTSSALAEALHRLNKIADRVPGMVYQFQLNPDGTSCFPFASEGIQTIYRVTPDEVSKDASVVFTRLHPLDSEQVIASIQESARDLSLWRHEYRVKFEDGEERWLLGNAMPEREGNGTVVWHGFITDITQRKQADNQLNEISSRLTLATRAGGIGVWDYDILNNILFWDDQMLELYGISKCDFDGAYEAWQHGLHPDDREEGDAHFQMAINGVKEFNTEFRVVWPNGIIRNIRALALVQRDDSGQAIRMIGTNWDITGIKESEAEILKARNEAEAANEAKSEFLSRMSHELRTPLNSILGFAQLLEMGGELTQKQKKGLSHILTSGKHLLNLINEVLEITRIESGHLPLALESVELSSMLSEMITTIQPQAMAREIDLVVEDSAVNYLSVKSDRLQLKQVLLNLLSNAVKYNREGGSITLKTTLKPLPESGKVFIQISITDTGLGISTADMPKLFQPFVRIGAEKSSIEGTGLGLAVVKKLMNAMGGQVGVKSTPDVGSTFWIELPQSTTPIGSINSLAGSLRDDLHPSYAVGTILYIEDTISNVELVEQVIASHRPDITLVTTGYGKETLPLALKHKPDLIFLDLNLPDINGFEVIKLLMHNENTRDIPIVMISANALSHQLEKAEKAGARNYLTKPLDIIAFLSELDKWISK